MTVQRVATPLGLLLAIALAGCGSAGASLSPRPVTPAVSLEATPAPPSSTPAPLELPIITCALPLADGSLPPTKPLPETLPARLPIDLVPADAAIYAMTYPQQWTWMPDALYMVGPAGGTCAGYVGTGLGMQVFDGNGNAVVDYVEPWTIGPSQELSCAYIAAARKGAEAEWRSIDPGACVPSPGDRITEIATGVKDSYLAVVASSTPPWLGSDMSGITTSLYSFRKGDEDDRGTSWRVTCATSTLPAKTCLAALVFFAGGRSDVEMAIGAALGVPPTPVP